MRVRQPATDAFSTNLNNDNNFIGLDAIPD